MIPLARAPDWTFSHLEGLLFDLDDTVLSHGTLSRAAYSAIWDLHEAGLRTIAVTGRPAGWGELLVRQWPVDAVVTENGAVAFVRSGRGLERLERCSPEERFARRALLLAIVERVRLAVPEASLSDDSSMRASDVAWDIGERTRLSDERVAALESVLRDHGVRSTRSSVHVHATYDVDDKASGTVRLLARRFDVDPSAALVRYGFVGDSGNDAACFSAFQTTFGVANVSRWIRSLARPPAFVTESEMGEGFAEVARKLLASRAARTHAADSRALDPFG